MNLDVGGVHHQPFIIGVVDDHIQRFLPDSPVPPTTRTMVRVISISIVRGQIPPEPAPYPIRGSPSARHPEHRVQEQPVVLGWPSQLPRPSRQVKLQKFPYSVRHIVAPMRCRTFHTPHSHLFPQFHLCYHFVHTPWKSGRKVLTGQRHWGSKAELSRNTLHGNASGPADGLAAGLVQTGGRILGTMLQAMGSLPCLPNCPSFPDTRVRLATAAAR